MFISIFPRNGIILTAQVYIRKQLVFGLHFFHCNRIKLRRSKRTEDAFPEDEIGDIDVNFENQNGI